MSVPREWQSRVPQQISFVLQDIQNRDAPAEREAALAAAALPSRDQRRREQDRAAATFSRGESQIPVRVASQGAARHPRLDGRDSQLGFQYEDERYEPQCREEAYLECAHERARSREARDVRDRRYVGREEESRCAQGREFVDPPLLDRRRPLCAVQFCLVVLVSAAVATTCLIVQVNHPFFRMPSMERRVATELPRRRASALETLGFGVWDATRVLTPMQVIVSVSLALGPNVHDEDVHAVAAGSGFFDVRIDHASSAMRDFINDASFLTALNDRTKAFSASLVFTRSAVLMSNSTSPSTDRAAIAE